MQKLFSDRVFYDTIIADAGIESLKHHLISICITWTKKYGPNYANFELFAKKKKNVNHFWQSVAAILEDVWWITIFFW